MEAFVSVIIPLYNDSRITETLRALTNQSYPQANYEVIVADNGSRQDVLNAVKQYCGRYPGLIGLVEERERQSSYAARNKGIAAAKGAILAFTDSDCIPEPDWLEKGVAGLQANPHCGLLAGRVQIFFRHEASPTAVELYDSIYAFRQQYYLTVANFGVTANLFTYRTVMENVGWFNGKLLSGGDLEWGQRVKRAGYSQVYAADASVRHPARQTWKEFVGKIKRTARGEYVLSSEYSLMPYGYTYVFKSALRFPIKQIYRIFRHQELKGSVPKAKVALLRTCEIYLRLSLLLWWLMSKQIPVSRKSELS